LSTELIDEGQPHELRRTARLAVHFYAGSDIARGETLLRHAPASASRSVCSLWSDRIEAAPKVVLSTGDELVEPGSRQRGVYDSNGAIIAAAVAEAGGEPLVLVHCLTTLWC
jgi:putative molybdopterin biosynthesis protein